MNELILNSELLLCQFIQLINVSVSKSMKKTTTLVYIILLFKQSDNSTLHLLQKDLGIWVSKLGVFLISSDKEILSEK